MFRKVKRSTDGKRTPQGAFLYILVTPILQQERLGDGVQWAGGATLLQAEQGRCFGGWWRGWGAGGEKETDSGCRGGGGRGRGLGGKVR